MPKNATILSGQCHCGAVRFEATLSDGFSTIRRCTCSYCRMRGAIAVSAEMGGVSIVEGEEVLTSYRFNTGTAQHFFCSRCGIYTHHQRRSNPGQYGVNHPNDNGGATRSAGTLRYIPAGDPS
ncbi:MAG: GFA family protein [Janthinobacterium lividum]